MQHVVGVIVIGISLLSCLARAGSIAVSGFNEDVVTENAPHPSGHEFDIAGTDWIENGVGGAVGLPSSLSFTSATGSGVVYQLQPYTANNVLRMGDNDPASGTMIVAAGRYSSLHILAASGTDGSALPPVLGQTSDITLNFADGSVTLPKALQAYDWDIIASKAPPSLVAIDGLDRNIVSLAPPGGIDIDLFDRHHFRLYETALDLGALGLSTRTLDSITFNDTSVHQATGVFAVDGTPTVPEPSSLPLLALVSAATLGRLRR